LLLALDQGERTGARDGEHVSGAGVEVGAGADWIGDALPGPRGHEGDGETLDEELECWRRR
jgi:hypothetical protein